MPTESGTVGERHCIAESTVADVVSTPSDTHEVGDKLVLSWPKRLHNESRLVPRPNFLRAPCGLAYFSTRPQGAREKFDVWGRG